MKTTKNKKKVQIDTSNYVSGGKGVSTTELIENPDANDELWSTLETEPETAPETDLQEIPAQYTPRLLFNLIRKDIAQLQKTYQTQVEIEKHLFSSVKELTLFNETELFSNYQDNKKAIVQKLKVHAQAFYKTIKKQKPALVKTIIKNEAFVTENLESIFIEKLLKINKVPLKKTETIKLARGFLLAFKKLAESSKK